MPKCIGIICDCDWRAAEPHATGRSLVDQPHVEVTCVFNSAAVAHRGRVSGRASGYVLRCALVLLSRQHSAGNSHPVNLYFGTFAFGVSIHSLRESKLL